MSKIIKNIGLLVLVTLTTVLVGNYAARAINTNEKTEFTMTVLESVAEGDGAISTKKLIYAYRRDGSWVKLDYREGGRGITEVKTVFDVQKGQSVTYNPHIQGKMTLPKTEKELEYASVKPLRCVSPEEESSVPTGTLLGFKVLKLVSEDNSCGEDHRVETWKAPDLNCEAVKYSLMRQNQYGKWETLGGGEATSIVMGPPDPLLFHEPEGYQEMSPIETFAKMRMARGLPNREPTAGERRDQDVYIKAHAQKK
jgi:hypothetical protein